MATAVLQQASPVSTIVAEHWKRRGPRGNGDGRDFSDKRKAFRPQKGEKIKQPLFPMPSVSSLATNIITDRADGKAGQLNPEALVTARGNRMGAIRATDSETSLALAWS